MPNGEIDYAKDLNAIEVNRFDCNLYPQPIGQFEAPLEAQQRPEGTRAEDDGNAPLPVGSKYSSTSGKFQLPPDAEEHGRTYQRATAKSQKNVNGGVGILSPIL